MVCLLIGLLGVVMVPGIIRVIEAWDYTVSRLVRLFQAPQTRCGWGLAFRGTFCLRYAWPVPKPTVSYRSNKFMQIELWVHTIPLFLTFALHWWKNIPNTDCSYSINRSQLLYVIKLGCYPLRRVDWWWVDSKLIHTYELVICYDSTWYLFLVNKLHTCENHYLVYIFKRQLV